MGPHLFSDAAYDRKKLMEGTEFLSFNVEIVHVLKEQVGFEVQYRRWLVERIITWLMHYHRLARDYECRIDVSKRMIYLGIGSTLLR